MRIFSIFQDPYDKSLRFIKTFGLDFIKQPVSWFWPNFDFIAQRFTIEGKYLC